MPPRSHRCICLSDAAAARWVRSLTPTPGVPFTYLTPAPQVRQPIPTIRTLALGVHICDGAALGRLALALLLLYRRDEEGLRQDARLRWHRTHPCGPHGVCRLETSRARGSGVGVGPFCFMIYRGLHREAAPPLREKDRCCVAFLTLL